MPKKQLTTASPEFISRKARKTELADFAVAVLQILENDKDWNSETTDAIAKQAQDRWLAGLDKDGMFRSLIIDP